MSEKYKYSLQDIRLHLLKGEIVQAFDKIENILIDIEKNSKEKDDFHTVKKERNLKMEAEPNGDNQKP